MWQVSLFLLLGSWGASKELPEMLQKNFLRLIVPEFSVHQVTMREALVELSRYGMRICYEEAPPPEGEEQVRFSIELRDGSVEDVLRQLVAADPRYTFQFPRGLYDPTISVFPSATVIDPDYPMNWRVSEVHLELDEATNSISDILRDFKFLIPELRDRLPPPPRVGEEPGTVGGVPGSILSGVPGGRIDVRMEFIFRDMTIRELLNELIFRSEVRGWWFVPEPEPQWAVFPPPRPYQLP